MARTRARSPRKYDLVVVEDATESLGSTWHGQALRHVRPFRRAQLQRQQDRHDRRRRHDLTDDEAHARHARHFTTTAKKAHAWAFDHDEVGYNYRLPNINAALGCAQMERLPAMVEAKRVLAERYLACLHGISPGRASIVSRTGSQSNYWLNTLVLDREYAAERDRLLEALHGNGVHARPLWTPMHLLPMYRDCPRSPLPVAEDMHTRCINLPSSPFLAAAKWARTRSDGPSRLLHHPQHDAVVEISGLAH